MRKHSFLVDLASFAIATVAVLACLFTFANQRQPLTIIIPDDKNPSEAMAVYVDPAVLKQHNLSEETFRAAFCEFSDGICELLLISAIEAFLPDENPHEAKERDTRFRSRFESRYGLTVEAFAKIVDTIRIELWTVHSNGTHTVTQSLSFKNREASETAASTGPTETRTFVTVAPTGPEEAKATFARDTGIAWPGSASDVRFDEKRVAMLGDGVFYVVFTVSPDVLHAWLRASPPWGGKRWLLGPIPADIGCHCGFGFERPRGWSAKEGGPKEYEGGAPEVLKILNSKSVRYAVRDRSPAGSSPWYNGDLLIIDPKTGVVRYCSWDM
jgi:hypothetical protein